MDRHGPAGLAVTVLSEPGPRTIARRVGSSRPGIVFVELILGAIGPEGGIILARLYRDNRALINQVNAYRDYLRLLY